VKEYTVTLLCFPMKLSYCVATLLLPNSITRLLSLSPTKNNYTQNLFLEAKLT